MCDIKKKKWVRVKKGTWRNTETEEMLFCDKVVFCMNSVLVIRGGVIILRLPKEDVDDSALYSMNPSGGT